MSKLETGKAVRPILAESEEPQIFSRFFSRSTRTIQIDPLYLMLSRLLNSAKSLFNPVPEIENNNQRDETVKISVDMVRTRQRGKAASDEDSIVVELPTSPRKRQRKSTDEADLAVDHVESPGSALKKQKLPVRAKDEETPNRSTRLVVEIPVSTINLGGRLSPGSKISPKSKEIVEIEDSEESDEGPEIVDKDSEDEHEASEHKEEIPNLNINSESPKKGENRLTNGDQKADAVKPKHKRFGSEEPEVEFFSTAVEKIESEDESSDDDAPEVVETQAAQKDAELKARDAARAIEE
jgi:hypothetical protein